MPEKFDLGILGSGQLGLMMLLEGTPLGLRFSVCDTAQGPAVRFAHGYFRADGYREFVDSSQYVTYEFEHVDGRALEYAEEQNKLRPSLLPVKLKRDRSLEKEFYVRHGIPTARYVVADGKNEIMRAVKDMGDCVVKMCEGGYDGKGQYYFFDGRRDEVPEGGAGKAIVEEFVRYENEASIICYRTPDGRMGAFEPSFNLNRNGILVYNYGPYRGGSEMRDIAFRLMASLSYVGVMGIEFYNVGGRFIVNEFAPRVHNTGHHTLFGFSVSQFEQHVRAVAGLPVHEPMQFVFGHSQHTWPPAGRCCQGEDTRAWGGTPTLLVREGRGQEEEEDGPCQHNWQHSGRGEGKDR